MKKIVNRMDSNEAIFKRIRDDEDFSVGAAEHYLSRIYHRLRSAG